MICDLSNYFKALPLTRHIIKMCLAGTSTAHVRLTTPMIGGSSIELLTSLILLYNGTRKEITTNGTREILGNEIQVRFTTDYSVTRQGWNIAWIALVNECAYGLDVCDENAVCIITYTLSYCSCNFGYEGDGRTCTGVDCGPPPIIDNSDTQNLYENGTRYQDRVTYTCLPGYEIQAGSHSITCQADQTWTATPTCTRVDCGPPPTIDNSDIQNMYENGTRYQDRVTYTCLPGYRIQAGSHSITCQADQTWTATPTCTRVDCGPPPTIDNSDTQNSYENGTRYQDRVMYTCLPGYEVRTGSHSITCEANQTWTATPTCTRVDCGPPPLLNNHDSQATVLTGTRYQDKVTYTCLPGYEIQAGSHSITCQADQTWTATPTCTKVNCGPPPVVDNSKRQVSGHSYNDTVRYECDVGYEMIGDDTIVCQETGYWTAHPDCEAITCGVPSMLDNVRLVSLTGTQFGQTATYHCLPDYTTDDPTYITCQLNGEWSRAPNCSLSPPTMEEISCGAPLTPANAGLVSMTGTQFGKTVIYQCLPGYTTDDSTHITCQLNRTWSHAPNCSKSQHIVEEVNCGPPPTVDNSKRRVFGYSYNDTVKYECVDGYEMIGDDTIICLEAGHWTVHPDCEEVTCGMPSTPDNAGLVSVTGTQFGQTATYQCLPGYTTDDPTYITCQLNGEWSRAPNCTLSQIVEEIDCGVAPQIESGNVLLATGTEARYTCMSGYEMTGEPVIECQSNQEWTTLPQCHRVSAALFVAEVHCGPPPVVDNSKRQVSGHSYNDTVRYECDVGYEMTGDDTIVCQEIGYWTVHPDCEVITCGLPLTPDNAGLVSMTGTQFGQTATYQCLPGYTTDDPTYITCQLNGEWSRAPNCTLSPILEEVNCGPPPVVDNSKRQVFGHSYNDTVKYECDVGYKMIGDDTIVCQETGYWTVHPDCEAFLPSKKAQVPFRTLGRLSIINSAKLGQAEQLARLLTCYQSMFVIGDEDMGQTCEVKHSIPLDEGTCPFYQPPHRLSPEKKGRQNVMSKSC
ncbi:sushi, von Willebrand factor type A, EGF and pentraxin domain-containing protein 1-like [Watersipora subatra]|uniref:sushi, von Willebrand factor type A, EGF and pentraxin domain-containing protein 1-like n=1 Tax=Watersipora subatra TaxID=2589382 RepID=UPI00355B7413